MGGIAIVCTISGGNIVREVKQMTTVEQIDYMIQSLKLAKDEIEYAEEYMKTKEKEGEDFWLIRDNCHTELEPEEDGRTLTVIGFKPMNSEIIDKIGKKYHLYI